MSRVFRLAAGLLVLSGTVALSGLVGCGTNNRDPGRVPEGAVDTSDPSKVNVGIRAPTGPAESKPGTTGGPPAPGGT
jgi:hypothetical protein